MARNSDESLGVRAVPDAVAGTVTDPLTPVFAEVRLEFLPCGSPARVWRSGSPAQYAVGTKLHVAFEPNEDGCVRATIEELPGVITCAPTLEEARELVRDALAE